MGKSWIAKFRDVRLNLWINRWWQHELCLTNQTHAGGGAPCWYTIEKHKEPAIDRTKIPALATMQMLWQQKIYKQDKRFLHHCTCFGSQYCVKRHGFYHSIVIWRLWGFIQQHQNIKIFIKNYYLYWYYYHDYSEKQTLIIRVSFSNIGNISKSFIQSTSKIIIQCELQFLVNLLTWSIWHSCDETAR